MASPQHTNGRSGPRNPDRKTNETKLQFYLQDEENTMQYKPIDMHMNKFFGTWSTCANMAGLLNLENKEKYYAQYQAENKARLELGSTPICFDTCIVNIDSGSGLSSDEKNCMVECYMKRISQREDLKMYVSQKLARINMRAGRDRLV